MRNKFELTLVIIILLLVGGGITWYKIAVLDFSMEPDRKATVWSIESAINFIADGEPVKVSFNMPDNSRDLVVTDFHEESLGFNFKVIGKKGERRAIWSSREKLTGPQSIYFRAEIYRRPGNRSALERKPPVLPGINKSYYTGLYRDAARELLQKAQKGSQNSLQTATRLISMLNAPENNPQTALLLKIKRDTGGRLDLARDLLTMARIPAQLVRGLSLQKDNRLKKLGSYIMVYADNRWQLLNPRNAKIENPETFLLWQRGGESLLEIEGGHDSKVRFSSMANRISANKAAIKAGKNKHSWLIDFSIYNLPLYSQNTFRLLLLIPFGALVVVILRNLVGIQTSGTFMPILIALAFLQTTLVVGIFLFITVVCVGLIMRFYLSHLNLLLVPRIAAILVFVIFIFLAISVIGHTFGYDAGLRVTFFPMIITSWSIERMCVLWEEEGGRDVLIQGSGTLLTASIVYILMKNQFIGNLIYSFPELLLVLLAIILIIGTYTGYRLSELRRFEPMGRE
jgi:hypothetical protein